MKVQFLLLAVDNVILTSLSAVRDVLQIANIIIARHQPAATHPLPSFESRLLSVDGKPVTTFCGLQLAVDGSIADAPQAGVIYLPNIYTAPNALRGHSQWLEQPEYVAAAAQNIEIYLRDHAQWLEALLPWLKRQRTGGAALAAVGTGSLILAEAGLLQGMRVPVPWVMEAFLHRRYPGIMPERHRDIVVADDIYCAGNLGSALALVIELIRRDAPTAITDLVAQHIRPLELALETPAVAASPVGSDQLVVRAMTLIQQRFSQTIDYEQLACNLAVSQRTLIRHFNHDLGLTPQAYQQQLRLEAAQRLLATTQLPVVQIAEHVGYANTTYFARLFRQRLGVSVQTYQEQCRQSRSQASCRAAS